MNNKDAEQTPKLFAFNKISFMRKGTSDLLTIIDPDNKLMVSKDYLSLMKYCPLSLKYIY